MRKINLIGTICVGFLFSLLLLICFKTDVKAADNVTDDGLVYLEFSDRVTISGYSGAGTNKYVNIPITINGKPVTFITTGAFEDKRIIGITIPSSVKAIGTRCFNLCDDLVEVNLSEGLEEIEMNAFQFCHSLENITIPASVKDIGAYAFYGCEGLKSVNILGQVSEIKGSTFSSCWALETLHQNIMTNLVKYALREVEGDVFWSAWRVVDGRHDSPRGVLKALGFELVLEPRAAFDTRYNCNHDKSTCVQCSGANCRCYEDLWLLKRK